MVTTLACGLRTGLFHPNRRLQVRMRVIQLLYEPITVQLDQMSKILA